MSEIRDPQTDQPAPMPTDGPHIHDLVVADMLGRKQLGQRKYGTPLQADNGRSHLQDAYEEALDLAVYLKAALEQSREVDAYGMSMTVVSGLPVRVSNALRRQGFITVQHLKDYLQDPGRMSRTRGVGLATFEAAQAALRDWERTL